MKLQSYGRGNNGRKLVLGNVTIYFSYQTPIAVHYPGGFVQRENLWGPTTGGHFKAAHQDVGRPAEEVVSTRAFEALLGELLSKEFVEKKPQLS